MFIVYSLGITISLVKHVIILIRHYCIFIRHY